MGILRSIWVQIYLPAFWKQHSTAWDFGCLSGMQFKNLAWKSCQMHPGCWAVITAIKIACQPVLVTCLIWFLHTSDIGPCDPEKKKKLLNATSLGLLCHFLNRMPLWQGCHVLSCLERERERKREGCINSALVLILNRSILLLSWVSFTLLLVLLIKRNV